MRAPHSVPAPCALPFELQRKAATRSHQVATKSFGLQVGQALHEGVLDASTASRRVFVQSIDELWLTTARATSAESREAPSTAFPSELSALSTDVASAPTARTRFIDAARALHEAAIGTFAHTLGAAMEAAVPPLATECDDLFRASFSERTARKCRRTIKRLGRAADEDMAAAIDDDSSILARTSLDSLLALLLQASVDSNALSGEPRAALPHNDDGAAHSDDSISDSSDEDDFHDDDFESDSSSADTDSSDSDSDSPRREQQQLQRRRRSVSDRANAQLRRERASDDEAALAAQMVLQRGRAAEARVAQLEVELAVMRADAAAETLALTTRLATLTEELNDARESVGTTTDAELESALAAQASELRFKYDVKRQALVAKHSTLRAKSRRRHERSKRKVVQKTEAALAAASAKARKAQAHFVDAMDVVQKQHAERVDAVRREAFALAAGESSTDAASAAGSNAVAAGSPLVVGNTSTFAGSSLEGEGAVKTPLRKGDRLAALSGSDLSALSPGASPVGSPSAPSSYSSLLQAALASAKVDHDEASEQALASALAAQGEVHEVALEKALSSAADAHRAMKKDRASSKKVSRKLTKEKTKLEDLLEALKTRHVELAAKHRRVCFRSVTLRARRPELCVLRRVMSRWRSAVQRALVATPLSAATVVADVDEDAGMAGTQLPAPATLITSLRADLAKTESHLATVKAKAKAKLLAQADRIKVQTVEIARTKKLLSDVKARTKAYVHAQQAQAQAQAQAEVQTGEEHAQVQGESFSMVDSSSAHAALESTVRSLHSEFISNEALLATATERHSSRASEFANEMQCAQRDFALELAASAASLATAEAREHDIASELHNELVTLHCNELEAAQVLALESERALQLVQNEAHRVAVEALIGEHAAAMIAAQEAATAAAAAAAEKAAADMDALLAEETKAFRKISLDATSASKEQLAALSAELQQHETNAAEHLESVSAAHQDEIAKLEVHCNAMERQEKKVQSSMERREKRNTLRAKALSEQGIYLFHWIV